MNKEEIICVKIKNQLFEQIIDILALECNQIIWKLMSIYVYQKSRRTYTLTNFFWQDWNCFMVYILYVIFHS